MEVSQRRVLIIDDDPRVTAYLATLLEDKGYVPCVSNDAEEGLQKVRQFNPDVIVLDILMPKKSGVQLFNKIKGDEGLAKIPVIILTAIKDYMIEDFRQFFASLRVKRPFAYLEKPVDPEELIAAVERSFGAAN